MNWKSDDPVGPLHIAPRRYLFLLGSFVFSVGLSIGAAGLEVGLLVAGLWLVITYPVVRVALWAERRSAERRKSLEGRS